MEQQNTLEQNQRNALRILALATEQYLKGQDELSRNFVGPQAQAAVEILNALLNERWGVPVEAEEAPADATPEAPVKAKKAK